MIRYRVVIAAAALAAFLVCGALTRGTAAAFTSSLTASGSVTVDRLGNYFQVTPGADVRPGTSTPVAAGDVDTLALTFGTVPSARTFANVFTVRNLTAQPQTAVLTLAGPSQLGSAVFTSTGTGTDTIPGNATSTVQVITSGTVAGRGAGTLRLSYGAYTWMYRDYATTIDLAPEAPGSLNAIQRPAGAIRLTWGASATVTNLAGYNVYRKTGAGAFTKLNATPLAATTYDDLATVNGTTYTYMVRALTTAGVTLESLDSPTATAVADATPPGQPSVVALANGGGTGSAYVNAANAAAVSVSVTLPAGSLATDVVTVTLMSGATSVSSTAAASAGTGTITVTGIDARGLADGTTTLGATSTDAAGNVSTVRSGSAPKDTAAPSAPSATYVDRSGNNADRITGTAEASAAIRADRVTPAPVASYTTAAAADGSYTVTIGAHRNVSVTYNVFATDAAGNTSAPTAVSAST
jgi:hypothetical protein